MKSLAAVEKIPFVICCTGTLEQRKPVQKGIVIEWEWRKVLGKL